MRAELGISQEELAVLLNCSRNSVASWENPNGHTIPAATIDHLEALVELQRARRVAI
jgi:transcriptional regulator with XRE-family HTH domain